MDLKNLLFGRRLSEKSADLSAVSEINSENVSRWLDIYNGGGEWRYTRKGGIKGGTRKVASLGAAKALCAELSRLCFTEGTDFVCADRETERYLKKVFDENCFSERISDFLEKAFASGGRVIKAYRDDNGVRLDFVTADCFVPTKWDSRGFYGGAFGSNVTQNGKNYIFAETQDVTDKGLIIENKLFDENGKERELSEVFPKMRGKTVIKGITKPLFVYFGTGAGKNRQCPPLGASVYADSEDTLKAIDIVFDSLTREFILGKKRIIVPSYAIRGEYDESGELKNCFDITLNLTRAGISGLRVNTGTETLRYGETAGLSVVDMYNPFMTQSTVNAVGKQLDALYFYGAEIEMQGLPFLESGEFIQLKNTDGSLTPIVMSEIRYHYDGALTAKLFSKNKFDSDPVVHLQKFENAISELWEYVHSLK